MNLYTQNFTSESDLVEIPKYIDRPDYVKNKSAGYLLQLLGWGLWMWLLMPLITLFLWCFEGQIVYEQLFLSFHINGKYSVYTLALSIGLFIAMLWIWASYNWIRFVNNERRSAPAAACINQISQSFDVNPLDIQVMQSSNNLTLYYNEQGQLINFEKTLIDKP